MTKSNEDQSHLEEILKNVQKEVNREKFLIETKVVGKYIAMQQTLDWRASLSESIRFQKAGKRGELELRFISNEDSDKDANEFAKELRQLE